MAGYCEDSSSRHVWLDSLYISCKFLLVGHQYYCFGFYSARNARIASAVLATAIPSVCLSVRPSARRYCVKTTARSTMQFSPLDSKMCLVL